MSYYLTIEEVKHQFEIDKLSLIGSLSGQTGLIESGSLDRSFNPMNYFVWNETSIY